jgi:hypothetical protein
MHALPDARLVDNDGDNNDNHHYQPQMTQWW